MDEDDCQPEGHGLVAMVTSFGVHGGAEGEDKQEGEEELDSEPLGGGEVGVEFRDTELSPQVLWYDTVTNTGERVRYYYTGYNLIYVSCLYLVTSLLSFCTTITMYILSVYGIIRTLYCGDSLCLIIFSK